MDTGRADMGNQQGNRQGWQGRPGKVTGVSTGRQGRQQGRRGGLAKWQGRRQEDPTKLVILRKIVRMPKRYLLRPTHSGLYTHWTSIIPHHQKRNLVFGLLDQAYKIASTYNAIHSELMNIESMLIRNGYPIACIDCCIMKYLNKKHETTVNSFTITPPMTTTINMRLPYLGEISYEVRREMQRLAHRYAMPFQFRLF